MSERFEDAGLDEMHVAATHAHHAGFTRVRADPLHIIELIDELQRHRRDHATLVAKDRAAAFALVERELRARGVRHIDITEHVICATRPGEGDVLAERAPMPTLLGAVDLLGRKESDR